MHRLRVLCTRTPLVLLGICLTGLVSHDAMASPPPPSFRYLDITNTTGSDVSNVSIELTPSMAPAHVDLGPPITMSFSTLPQDATITVTLPKTYGIARMSASGACPNPLPQPVVITAAKQNFNGQPGDEYAGFCYSAPAGHENYRPKIMFQKNPSNPQKMELKLSAHWRWDDHWSPAPVEASQQFP